MVEQNVVNSIIKELEKFHIKKSNYRLNGENYDLILLIPTDKYSFDNKFSLYISSAVLNKFSQKEIIMELLTDFNNYLTIQDYTALSRINLLNNQEPFVRNMNLAYGFRESIIQLEDTYIGDAKIDFAFLLKSLVLDKLVVNKAVTIELNDGQIINAGIKRIEPDFDIIHYTGKALREMWGLNLIGEEKNRADFLKSQEEDYLFENNYISSISLDRIMKIR
jgi:hypothetical protein